MAAAAAVAEAGAGSAAGAWACMWTPLDVPPSIADSTYLAALISGWASRGSCGMEGLRAALGLEAAPGGSEENICSFEIFSASTGAQTPSAMQPRAAPSAFVAFQVPAVGLTS